MDEQIMAGYARVSDILATLTDYSHIDPAVLANKAALGTEVHDAIALMVGGGFPVVTERADRYLQSWDKWHREVYQKFCVVEQRYYCDSHLITGRVDAVMRQNDRPVIVDYKTSCTVNTKVWQLQAHYYMWLYAEASGHNPEDCSAVFVQLKDNGKNPRCVDFCYSAPVMHYAMDLAEKYVRENILLF